MFKATKTRALQQLPTTIKFQLLRSRGISTTHFSAIVMTKTTKTTMAAAAAQEPPLNVVIVGGVAGGMSCATRLRRNDEKARITVLEKGPYVSYANCGIPYALGGVIADEAKLHVQTPAKLASWFNINVRTRTELVAIDRTAKKVRVKTTKEGDEKEEEEEEESFLPYDKLVLALGAQAVRPPIRGVEAPHVFTLQTIPDLQAVQGFARGDDKQHRPPPRTAVVVGAGFIGLEAAENLRQGLGLDVTVVEVAPHVFPPVDADLAAVLHGELERSGVRVLVSSRVTDIIAPSWVDGGSGGGGGGGKVLAESMDGGGKVEEVDADLVVVSTGVRPRSDIPVAAGLDMGQAGGLRVNAQMQTSDPDIYAVGDLVETPNLITGRPAQCPLAGPANRQGRLAADHMVGKQVAYRGNLGTAVCKVFNKTVGIVGFSVEALQRLTTTTTTTTGVSKPDFEYVTVHPPDHAAYYPGATPLTLRLAFETGTGRILGAQAVGEKGVDKRIDVLATVMRGGAGPTVEDLEHLELAYAPPYGAAKDPVNMAGFVAGNVMRGDVRVVHAADFANASNGGSSGSGGHNLKIADFQVVDVRSQEEYEKGHFVGAKNVPIAELRDRLGELDKTRRTVAYCWVGYRGYLASRVLTQSGFDVVNLDGGFKSVVEGGFESLEA